MRSKLLERVIKRGYFFDLGDGVRRTIVRTIEDGNQCLLVHKRYSAHNQRWYYKIEESAVVSSYLAAGIYTINKVKDANPDKED